MLDGQLLACEIKDVIARSLFASAGEAIRELAGVVGQKRPDHHRCDASKASTRTFIGTTKSESRSPLIHPVPSNTERTSDSRHNPV